MKHLILIFIFLTSIYLQSFCNENDTIKISGQQTSTEISDLQNEVKEIRRDQLNYLIEKNLLKETYSSNYQTINIVITLILGIFVVLGYLGIRDINNIKESYATKLKELVVIQNELEKQSKELLQTKEKSEKSISDLLIKSDEQNKKIKVLEIKEKIINLIGKNNFTSALEYIGVGLDIVPLDIELLRNKGFANFKLLNYSDSINAYEKLISIEKGDSNAIMDLAELYLCTEDLKKYGEIVTNNKSVFNSEANSPVFSYLQAFYFYKGNEIEKLLSTMINYIKNIENEDEKKIRTSWSFADVRLNIKKEEDTKLKINLLSFISFLEGTISIKELKLIILDSKI
jgi:tetratricopeptide (TPR) repeat protein